MLRLFKYLKPYWLEVLGVFIAIIIQVWTTLQLPALMADIVNNGIVKQDMDFIWSTGLLMLGCTAISALGAFFASLFSARVGSAFSRDLREDVFKQVLSFSITEIDNFSTASLITRTTNDIQQVQQAIVMCLSMLLRAPLMCVGAIIQAIATAPDMTWIIVLAVGVLLLLTVLILAAVMPKFKIFQKLVDKITLLTRENLTGLRVIRAFNKQKLEQDKFATANRELTQTNIFIGKIMSLMNPIMTLIFNGTTLLCIWIGINLITTDFSYLGNMMAFMQYAIQVILSFIFLTILFVVLPRANVSAIRINEILRTRPKIHWKPQTVGTPSTIPSVEFKKVCFAYDGAEAEVLHDISFTASAGQTTAFIGSTGSGKSTLINLVPRFYEATAGQILIDGLDVKSYSAPDLMQKIGYVPQRGVLFSGTVKSNIAFGMSEANQDTIEQSAKIAQATEFIEKLEKSYDSHIAQGGTNVSGGQKQRLSIARAIAKSPEILIFDDAFSALDMKTDAKLRSALKPITTNTVTLIVAQRINTIKDAEQIIVLDHGKIVGRGTHYHLLDSCKVYREIAQSQFSETEYQAELDKAKKSTSSNTKSVKSSAKSSASNTKSAKSSAKATKSKKSKEKK